MQQGKPVIENKAPRILVFPKQRNQSQTMVMNYMQNKQQQIANNKLQTSRINLPNEFYISLQSLEPKSQLMQNPGIELIKTLVDSYQLIIEQLQQDKQEGLLLYFQNKLNQILEQPQVQQQIRNSNETDLIKMIDKMELSIKQQNTDENELIQLSQQYRKEKSNSLVNYINMQEKLEQEQLKSVQMIQEFDQAADKFEGIKQKELNDQDAKIQDRLKKRKDTQRHQQLQL